MRCKPACAAWSFPASDRQRRKALIGAARMFNLLLLGSILLGGPHPGCLRTVRNEDTGRFIFIITAVPGHPERGPEPLKPETCMLVVVDVILIIGLHAYLDTIRP
jgi:hypothetical protein